MIVRNRLGQAVTVGNRRRHCRCRVCGARQVKAKHPSDYLRPLRCRSCGSVDSLRIDRWADQRGWRHLTCYCDGYHFPHRIKSEWCYHTTPATPPKTPSERCTAACEPVMTFDEQFDRIFKQPAPAKTNQPPTREQ